MRDENDTAAAESGYLFDANLGQLVRRI